ncbi:MAG: response regulator [Gammaproteobacteria bacterium]|nr:response regulator [Gammaproteobacteria bacterium]
MAETLDIAQIHGATPDFCVIGIGASAGGLEALRALFSRLPPAPGFACVVIVHLSPEHESHLVRMLQPYTQMPVRQVSKTTALEPNCVYVIPPNANLNSIDTHLRLSQLEGRRVKRAPIDHFLRTLADTHGERAVAVILSGAGSDGALGIRQIRDHGGLTIAQDPREAEFDGMPQAAIATGTIDLVLSLRDVADELLRYCATPPWVGQRGPGGALAEDDAAQLERILGEIRLRTGQEFAMFRREMLLQRVRRRMRLRHVGSLQDYFAVLQSQTGEPRALYNDLLLNVTDFFRDPQFYDTVERVLQEILARKDEREQRVRIWSIGCSTGEEAYSLAMLLMEQSAARSDEPLLQVFASELSADALQHAREGLYPQEIAASISQERLDRFFTYENGRYRVRRELRDMVTFANHDLFRDPPYSHLDLVVCRSLLRDLQAGMRRGVLNLFYYALEPHGLLLLDPRDEADLGDLYTRDASHPGLLRRNSGPHRVLQLPAGLKPFDRASGERSGAPRGTESFDTPSIFRRAVEHYTPASVLVDSDNRVVHFSVNAARYVRLPGGELTLDILSLLPRGLARRLKIGLQEARREKRSWTSEPFVVLFDGRGRRVTLRIDRVNAPAHLSELLLVVFDDTDESRGLEPASDPTMLDQVLKLQTELETVHEQLAAMASVPQPRSATQEQRSDQLRAVIEELDGAREELQAVNEELISVNQENRSRIETLSQLSNDLQHLLEATGFATVLLDRELNIVRLTPLAAELLRLRESDLGRPLADLRHHLRYDRLIDDLRPVVEELSDLEVEVESDDGRWYLVRAQPYRTAQRGLEGAVLLFIDVTDRKRAELALRNADRRKEEFLAVLAHELRNPLAPIVAGLELLRKLPDDTALVQRVSATMARQTKQLVRLVDDLLEVVRINEDKLTLRIEPVVVAEVVRDALTALRPVMENFEHEVTLDLPEERLTVAGDAARLIQVFGNLLSNAARYTAPRGRILVRVWRDEERVRISVQDNGRGLSAQSLASVFEMFYQARDPGLTSTGLGIGLTLAKKLTEMHGGTITAESAGPTRGSTFTVELPLAGRDVVVPAQAALPEDAAPVARGRRVLIVDDNEDAAETLCLLMKSLGTGDVRTASNGPEALATAAGLCPDVVLLDLGMPGMDGYELARRMRAESWGKEAYLVALTGWGQEQHRRRSQEAGFDRHLVKPADVDALRTVLESA